MKWLTEHTDSLGLVVASVAIGLSLLTTVLGARHRRQDTYLHLHEMLTTTDMQRGRRLIYEIGRTGVIPVEGSEDHAAVNRTLAAHSNMAMYVRRRVVPRRWVLDSWHHTLRSLKPGATAVIEHRLSTQTWRVWTDLESLMRRAETYRSRLPCCTNIHQQPGRPHSGSQADA